MLLVRFGLVRLLRTFLDGTDVDLLLDRPFFSPLSLMASAGVSKELRRCFFDCFVGLEGRGVDRPVVLFLLELGILRGSSWLRSHQSSFFFAVLFRLSLFLGVGDLADSRLNDDPGDGDVGRSPRKLAELTLFCSLLSRLCSLNLGNL